jgi:hypothetical protein
MYALPYIVSNRCSSSGVCVAGRESGEMFGVSSSHVPSARIPIVARIEVSEVHMVLLFFFSLIEI